MGVGRVVTAEVGVCLGPRVRDESLTRSSGGTTEWCTREGNRSLRVAPVEAAHAAGRTHNTCLRAHYHRLAAHRGKKKAAVAVAHSILVIAYRLLNDGASYHDLGADFFDRRNQDALERRLVKRLEQLGNKVTLEKVA